MPSASKRTSGYIRGTKELINGRMSMSVIAPNVTHIPCQLARPSKLVDSISGLRPLDTRVLEAGNLRYEIATSPCRRYPGSHVRKRRTRGKAVS